MSPALRLLALALLLLSPAACLPKQGLKGGGEAGAGSIVAGALPEGADNAQAEAEAEKAAKEAEASAPGSVWVVEAKDGGGRIFLCGTIHILRESDYPLAPGYEAAYSNATRLVFELPPGAGEGPDMQRQVQALGMFPSGQTLRACLPEQTWKNTVEWGKKNNFTESSLDRLRPWFVALLITSTEYARLGAKPQWGVDNHFEHRAAEDGKPAEGLETVEFQLQLFSGLAENQQVEMLEQTLGEIATLPGEYSKMISAWKRGELEELGEMLLREQAKFPDLMDIFLFSRNERWMEPLEKMLNRGERVMLLVGTGHFAAEKGLLRLFRDRGYRVRHYREVEDL